MLAAGLPIYPNNNPFWLSEQGLRNTDRFLSKMKASSEIDEVFILSAGPKIQKLAEKYHIEVLQVDTPFSIDGPYTFSQTTFWAREFYRLCPLRMDEMVIVDHRNLDFTINALKEVLCVYDRHRTAGVISVALCQDHPCQFRSYASFLGCSILRFRQKKLLETERTVPNQGLSRIVRSSRSDWGKITLRVHPGSSTMGIRIDCQKIPINKALAHVLPLSDDGPLYELFFSVSVACTGVETLVECDCNRFSGAIITLFTNDLSGPYDTVEFFTPENADWEIGTVENVAVDKRTHIPIQGRQQFTPVYAYDGAFYANRANVLCKKGKIKPVPVILNRSNIVTDWVEYYRHTCIS